VEEDTLTEQEDEVATATATATLRLGRRHSRTITVRKPVKRAQRCNLFILDEAEDKDADNNMDDDDEDESDDGYKQDHDDEEDGGETIYRNPYLSSSSEDEEEEENEIESDNEMGIDNNDTDSTNDDDDIEDEELMRGQRQSRGRCISNMRVMASSMERFISFTKSIEIITGIDDKGKKIKKTIQSRFIDSIRFLNSSLDALARTLPKDKFVNTKCKFPNPHHTDLVTRKGVFPYEYITSMEVYNESELPPLLAFATSLTGN